MYIDLIGGHFQFDLIGWGVFFSFVMVGIILLRRRYYRQRYRRGAGGPAVATVYTNSMQVPPSSNPSYPVLPPGSYPAQQYPTYYLSAESQQQHDNHDNSNLPPNNPPAYSSAWSQPGLYMNDGAVPYQPGGYHNPQFVGETHPQYPSSDLTHFTPGASEPILDLPPPPSYESINDGNVKNDQEKSNSSDVTTT